MKLNKKVEIGIKAVGVLRTRQTHIKNSELAVEVGTTVNFLEQIMRNLRAAGIVSVKRGPGGGYFLNRTEPVSALEVANAVGSTLSLVVENDNSPANLLRKSITDAFIHTSV